MKRKFMIAVLLMLIAVGVTVLPVSAAGTEDLIQAVQTSAVLSADKVSLGGTVTVLASETAGNTYAFYYRPPESDIWKCNRTYSEKSKANIKASVTGVYDVCVKTKSPTGKITKEYLSFESVDFSTDIRLEKECIRLGMTQTVYAVVSDSSGEYSYKFYCKNPTDNSWRLIQNSSGGNKVNFKPSKSGIYEVCAKVTDKSGNVRKAYAEFSVNEALTVSHTLSAKSTEIGTPLIVTPSSAGGIGNIQYAVYYTTKELYETGANKWTVALKYGQGGNAVIKPNESGEYVVVTKAKDSDGTVKKTEYTYFSVTEKLTVEGSFKNDRSIVYYRTGTVFNAQANGGSGSYTYALKVREKGTSEWKMVRDFAESPQFSLKWSQMGSYTSTSKDNFELTVIVMDKNGRTAEAVYTFTVTESDRYELPLVFPT